LTFEDPALTADEPELAAELAWPRTFEAAESADADASLAAERALEPAAPAPELADADAPRAAERALEPASPAPDSTEADASLAAEWPREPAADAPELAEDGAALAADLAWEDPELREDLPELTPGVALAPSEEVAESTEAAASLSADSPMEPPEDDTELRLDCCVGDGPKALEIIDGRKRARRPVVASSKTDFPSLSPSTGSGSGTPGLRGTPSLVGMAEWLLQIGHSADDINALNIIHIAGTKGKGSTCAFTESFLRAHGQRTGYPAKTGLYTSPDLIHPEERIRLNGTPIDRSRFAQYFFEIYDRLPQLHSPYNPSKEPVQR
ncbi:hypothetical protein B0A55_13288, partial [Friedmanniomyces simplex]